MPYIFSCDICKILTLFFFRWIAMFDKCIPFRLFMIAIHLFGIVQLTPAFTYPVLPLLIAFSCLPQNPDAHRRYLVLRNCRRDPISAAYIRRIYPYGIAGFRAMLLAFPCAVSGILSSTRRVGKNWHVTWDSRSRTFFCFQTHYNFKCCSLMDSFQFAINLPFNIYVHLGLGRSYIIHIRHNLATGPTFDAFFKICSHMLTWVCAWFQTGFYQERSRW